MRGSRRPAVSINQRRRKDYHVFISHSFKDRWIAQQMSRLILALGKQTKVSTFLDEKDIKGGDSIPEAIRENIAACDEFVVLITRNSCARPWVLTEIGAAWGQRKLIVALIDQVLPNEMPEVIAAYKAIDLNDFDQYLAQLLVRAKKKK